MNRFQHHSNRNLYSDRVRSQGPGKWNSNHTVPFNSSSASGSSDLKRLEGLMTTMANNLGALTNRLDVIEKGQPSRDETRPNTGFSKGKGPVGKPPGHVAKSPAPHAQPWPALVPSASSSRPVPSTSSSRSSAPAATPAAQPVTKSTNPDFHTICKALNRTVQIRRHMSNWNSLPAAIDRNLKHVAQNIRPVHPSDQLTQDITDIFNQTGLAVRDRVQRHFSERLELNLATLRHCQPLDKDRAVEVVTRQLRNRLGSKVTEPAIRGLVEKEGEVIGNPSSDTFFCKPGPKSSKKHCLSKSPATVSFLTPNPYSALTTDDGDDDQNDSASPPRKVSQGASAVISSLPSTPKSTASRKLTSTTPSVAKALNLPASVSSATAFTSSDSADLMDTEPVTASSSLSSASSSFLPLPPVSPTGSVTRPTELSSSSAPTAPPRYTLHPPNLKSSWNVTLRPDTRCLIISDSNFKRLGEEDIPQSFQLECFSGATFTNALQVIQNLPSGQLDFLVVSIGINHKEDDCTSRTVPAATKFLAICLLKAKEVLAVGVSVNPNFPVHIQDNLMELNANLLDLVSSDCYILPLPSNKVSTDRLDLVHYTRDTQTHILRNIVKHMDNMTKN